MSHPEWRRKVSRCAPTPVRHWVASGRLTRLRRRNESRSVEEVFSEIYSSHMWGEPSADEFDSGSGSRGAAASAYAGCVREVIRQTGARSAIDIGCGDFRVGAQFVDALDSYHGVDVVQDLVARNTALHGRPGVRFAALDASSDDLPGADLCLIRQVLQHLSNLQIANILHRCRQYPLVLITEHQPAPGWAGEPNRDKPHGPDTRLDTGSWVDIGEPPFACAPVQEVLCIPAPKALYQSGEVLSTRLWRPAPTAGL